MRHRPAIVGLAPLLALALAACEAAAPPQTGDLNVLPAPSDAACADAPPLDQPLFGDTHVHTSYSLDAWGNGNTALDPTAAYRFARGEAVEHPFRGRMQLVRPLDFAIVTDHAEFFDVVGMCLHEPGRPEYELPLCRRLRERPEYGNALLVEWATGLIETSDFPDAAADRARRRMWQRIRNANNSHHDPCRFSTLHGFEWTGGSAPFDARRGNLHRNVIFAGNTVPDEPFDAIRYSHESLLWSELAARCRPADGCDVLAIPHNSNLSIDGAIWTIENGAQARQRARYEPLVEIYQHKGSSECANLDLDPQDPGFEAACDFEALSLDNPFQAALAGGSGPSRASTVRSGLLAGLRYAREHGLNPLELGLIASTDTHMAAAGMVEEADYLTHGGVANQSERGQLQLDRDNGAGGLAAVWAERNTRAAIFAALRRREVYGTSGPRIVLRSYAVTAGTASADACAGDALPRAALQSAGAVPMGGVLRGVDGPVAYIAEARADAQPLERLELVTLAVADDGRVQEAVQEISAVTAGAERLCGALVAEDRNQAAVARYVRALERPTPRWSYFLCLRHPDLCPGDPDEHMIRERAWSSPIWRYGAAATTPR